MKSYISAGSQKSSIGTKSRSSKIDNKELVSFKINIDQLKHTDVDFYIKPEYIQSENNKNLKSNKNCLQNQSNAHPSFEQSFKTLNKPSKEATLSSQYESSRI